MPMFQPSVSGDVVNVAFAKLADGAMPPGWSAWGGTVGATAVPRVVGGMLTFAPVAGGAGYMHRRLDGPVRQLSAEFELGAETTTAGSIDLISWDDDYEQSYPTIPNSPCHFVIRRNGWAYDTVTGGVVTNRANGVFDPPLSEGVKYSAAVTIDHERGRAMVTLPTGVTLEISHADISAYRAKYAVFELFRVNATDAVGAFHSFAASDVVGTPAVLHEAAVRTQGAAAAITWPLATGTSDIAVPTTMTDVDAVNAVLTSGVVPASGKMLFRVTGYLQQTAAAAVLWNITDANLGSLFNCRISETVQTGVVSLAYLKSGLTPGRTLNCKLRHMTTVAGSANLQLSHSNGRVLTIEALPIA